MEGLQKQPLAPKEQLAVGVDVCQLHGITPAKAVARNSHQSLRVNRQDLLEQIHDALVRPSGRDETLELVLDRAFEHLRPETGVVLLKNGQEGSFPAATRSISADSELTLPLSLMNEVAENGHGTLMRTVGTQKLLVAPLRYAQELLGMIVLGSPASSWEPSEDDRLILQLLAAVATQKLLADQHRCLERELALARQIQLALLPDRLPEVKGYQVLGENRPSGGVSGDYYESVSRADGAECVLMVVDVSGAGIGASLLASAVEALSATPVASGRDPAKICEITSHQLYDRTSLEKYATAFVAVLEPRSGRLLYSNAGHCPALLIRGSGAVAELGPCGFPLGMMPDARYELKEEQLAERDTLLIYTDGITEAENSEGKQYGPERLIEACRRHRNCQVEELMEAVHRELEAFADGSQLPDDRTLLVTQRLARG